MFEKVRFTRNWTFEGKNKHKQIFENWKNALEIRNNQNNAK